MNEMREQNTSRDDPYGESIPKVIVTGDNYDVGGIKAIVANIIGYLKMVAIALCFASDPIFMAMFGQDKNKWPDAVKDFDAWLQENKMQFGLMAVFGGMIFQNALLQSGAFEMYIDGDLKFSKLEAGRLPTVEDIHGMMSEQGIHFS